MNWSPDSKQLASAGSDKTVRLWNISDGQQVQNLDHDRAVRSLIWSPDGQQLATCADDDIVRIWSIGKKASTSRAFDRLPSPVAIGPYGMAWSSDGKLIALAAADAGARVLDVKTGKLSEPFIHFVAGMQCVAWSSDNKQILAANGWEVGYRTVTAKESAVVNGLGAPVFWHPDKRRFVTGCWGGYPIQSFDTRKATKLGTLIPRFGIGVAHWVCIGPDGHFRGSENVESQLVVVAIAKDGGQKLYSIVDFSEKYGWKNDPAKARLLKLDDVVTK
ncbi:MAG: hypothetical protein NT013_08685 [Planctomycetia bacterium]|nr:hypothetical protein [Planctomycetia bacterium]